MPQSLHEALALVIANDVLLRVVLRYAVLCAAAVAECHVC